MTTRILGMDYAGRPMFDSLAMRLWSTEQDRGTDAAQALLDAHNHIRAVFGKLPPYDIAEHMTDCPMEGLVRCSALIDRVVERTARAA